MLHNIGAKVKSYYSMKNVYYATVFALFSTVFPEPGMYRAFNKYLLHE